jgi:hypothetical protein
MAFRVDLPKDLQITHDACMDAWRRWHIEWCRLQLDGAPTALCEIYGMVVERFADGVYACRHEPDLLSNQARRTLRAEAAHLTPSEQYAYYTGQLGT